MVIFRNMTEKDASAVAELEKQIFSDAWTESGLRETFKQPQAQILVAEEEGAIVGYAIFYCVLDEGELARIAVANEYQRQGVGCQLMACIFKTCREKGIAKIFLEVRESNGHARNFYKKHGFEEDGIRKNFYQMPTEHAILMSKAMPVLPTGSEEIPTL